MAMFGNNTARSNNLLNPLPVLSTAEWRLNPDKQMMGLWHTSKNTPSWVSHYDADAQDSRSVSGSTMQDNPWNPPQFPPPSWRS
ncbi:hypothetical protein IAQ61_004628 [Plenodomus lingam]|uniref:uncharacterized protein n=1 Tax=Leptosphaeria maculans TaxID=5022 RepID=UPI003328F798|nr:hypothetical protein IAQ61_004628 [Plenodomus lingam]